MGSHQWTKITPELSKNLVVSWGRLLSQSSLFNVKQMGLLNRVYGNLIKVVRMGFVGLFMAVNSIVIFEEDATVKIGEFWTMEDGIFYLSFLCLSGWFLFGERIQGFTL